MENELDNIIFRMQVCKLESKLALREIERDGLDHEIAATALPPDRWVQAIDGSEKLHAECDELLADLETLRHSHHG